MPRIRQAKLPHIDPGIQSVAVPNLRQEAGEQAALFEMIRRMEGRFPELRWIFHIPNGGARPAQYYTDHQGRRHRYCREGKDLQAQGVRPGVPDICCPARRTFKEVEYTGLWIEMKVIGGTVEPEQKAYHHYLRSQGFCVTVKYGWLEAWKAICGYYGIETNEEGVPVL